MQVSLKRMLCYWSQIRQQCQRSYCLIFISILVTQTLPVSSQGISTYYVSSASNNRDGWCSMHNQHLCFNLTEVAKSMVSGRFILNLSFILAPGNHSLLTNLTIAGRTHFLMKSEDSQQPAIINCGESSQIRIHSSTYVHLHGIILNRCVENEVKVVKNLTIEDSTFSAIGTTDVSGRALTISNSTVIILQSTFKYFSRPMTLKPRGQGGVILTIQSDVSISNSMFFMNQAGKGGVMYSLGSTVVINNSTFTKNSASRGGVLYIERNRNATNNHLFQKYLMTTVTLLTEGSVSCTGSNFTINKASKGGVIHLDQSNFEFNNASSGAVFVMKYSDATVFNCGFQYNKANQTGGVGYCHRSKLLIKGSTFCFNQAENHGGALYLNEFAKAVIDSGKFYNNVAAEKTGSSLQVHRKSNVILTGMISFERDSARYMAAINIYDSNITFNGSINVTDTNGSISLTHSTGHFAGYMLFKDNKGPIHLHDSKVVVSGLLTSIKQKSHYMLEGGSISLFLASMIITGKIVLNDSIATNGGGIRSISSTILVDVRGTLIVANNTATDTGGGIYFYHSLLRAHGLVLVQGNKANTFGGGIHCITSTIVLIGDQYSQYIKLANNKADYGGGICLEASSKFYIKRLRGTVNKYVQYIENSALYGGAIYVVDNTTTGTCASSSVQTVTKALRSDCFFQLLRPETNSYYPPIENYMYFAQNNANISGKDLYGGLLDRCTVYISGKKKQYSTITRIVQVDTTSDPVRVCFCISEHSSSMPNCTHSPPTMHIVKGSNFTLQVAAVDHVNREVNATIIGSLKSRNGHLGKGQQKQVIGATCTKLNFSVITPKQDYDHLVLYADGPCKDLGISALRMRISFDPCRCPTGFEPESETKDRCVCRCHHVLKKIFPDIECNSETLLILRNHDYWLSSIKKGKLQLQYFLTYKQCPADNCHPSTTTVHIYLNDSNGSDVQCAFNHTGVLCGSCQPNLTLSLGSSHCIECPQFWPAITVAMLIGAFLAGLALVALILVLNLTVANGTLNGVIFYANIITIDQQLFMPFERPNFHSIFIAWLNLDIGFDVCFFKGLNAYAKAWLQLTFPLYIILIVVAVIVASRYSKKFANFVSRKNPVATLATLILLSYAKLLHNIIEILSYAILHYTAKDESDSFTRVVWLYDGSIGYLNGIHIPLFIVAVLIVIIGSIYTFLFLFWQCLVKLSDKAVFHWVRNTKLSSFMDAYHAPYMARNRYWTGLLLLARVILHLTAAINVSGEPSVNLLAILVVIGCISLLHAYSGISIYKKWPLNVLEYTTYFNILVFTAAKFYILMVGGNHAAIAYVSISVQFALFVFSLLHHIMLECHILVKVVKQTICRYKSRFSQNLSIPLLENDVQHTAPTQMATYSEVAINPEIQLTSGMDSEREGLSLLLSTENGQF